MADFIREEWQKRSRRNGVVAVMSARHTHKENEIASEKMKRDIMNFLERNYGPLDNKRILELGCGIGRFTRELALKSRGVVAVDMTPGMIEKAKAYTSDIKNITYITSKISELDVDSLGQFDLVFEAITLLHILDEAEYKRSLGVMKSSAPYIFICEHMADNAPVSQYSRLRAFEEYENDFHPFKLASYDKNHYCVTDWFPLMLFKRSH
ncbi:MAG: class I SAM-dependent methyltransferase [Candidatus Aenigmatarchaeota archaeon]